MANPLIPTAVTLTVESVTTVKLNQSVKIGDWLFNIGYVKIACVKANRNDVTFIYENNEDMIVNTEYGLYMIPIEADTDMSLTFGLPVKFKVKTVEGEFNADMSAVTGNSITVNLSGEGGEGGEG